jgi:uncharacterized membrane protein YqaE (UPF0057 family)
MELLSPIAIVKGIGCNNRLILANHCVFLLLGFINVVIHPCYLLTDMQCQPLLKTKRLSV